MSNRNIKLLTEHRSKLKAQLNVAHEARSSKPLSPEASQGHIDTLKAEIGDASGRILNLEDQMARDEVADQARRDSPIPDMGDGTSRRSNEELAGLLENREGSLELPFEKRDLTVGASGASMVDQTLVSQFVSRLYEASGIFANADVITTQSAGDFIIPLRTGSAASAAVAEAATYAEKDPTVSNLTLGAFKAGSLTDVSAEMEQDNGVDLRGMLAEHASDSLGQIIGPWLATGAGTTEPTGLFTAAATGVTAVATAAITADELLGLKHSVGARYRGRNAKWVMSDETFFAISKLKDGQGNYLLGSAGDGASPRIFGHEVVIDEDSPAMATGLDSIAFGDLSRFKIRQAGGFQLDRSEHAKFADGLIVWRFGIRLDSGLSDANAVKVLTMA